MKITIGFYSSSAEYFEIFFVRPRKSWNLDYYAQFTFFVAAHTLPSQTRYAYTFQYVLNANNNKNHHQKHLRLIPNTCVRVHPFTTVRIAKQKHFCYKLYDCAQYHVWYSGGLAIRHPIHGPKRLRISDGKVLPLLPPTPPPWNCACTDGGARKLSRARLSKNFELSSVCLIILCWIAHICGCLYLCWPWACVVDVLVTFVWSSHVWSDNKELFVGEEEEHSMGVSNIYCNQFSSNAITFLLELWNNGLLSFVWNRHIFHYDVNCSDARKEKFHWALKMDWSFFNKLVIQ